MWRGIIKRILQNKKAESSDSGSMMNIKWQKNKSETRHFGCLVWMDDGWMLGWWQAGKVEERRESWEAAHLPLCGHRTRNMKR